MADVGLYRSARNLFLTGGLDWTGDTPGWKLYLLTADYVVARDTHSTVADLLPVQAISTTGDINNRTVFQGIARADNVVTAGGGIGQEVTQVVIACGNDLVWWSDNSPQLPYLADGGFNLVVWDAVSLGPFEL